MPGVLRARAALGRRRAPRYLRAGIDALIAALLAPRCLVCAEALDAPLHGPVCPLCWGRVVPLPAPLCRTCGDPLPSWRMLSAALECCAWCRRAPGAIDAARAAAAYDDTLRAIVHAFKYEGRRGLARPLGALMRDAGRDVLHGAGCVVPVPLHPWRRLRRGFNQADDLARQIGLPVEHLLWRTARTSPQAGLAAPARRRNVRGAFQVSPLLTPSARDRRLRGRVVVLIDDVRTTGATLQACAAVLKQAGAREVRALTAASARRSATSGKSG